MTSEERRPGAAALDVQQALDALKLVAALLFAHAQTTERTIQDIKRFANALGLTVTVSVSWDGIALGLVPPGQGGGTHRTDAPAVVVSVTPTLVDMGKVAAVVSVIDRTCERGLRLDAAIVALQQIERAPSVSTLRFSLMAGIGAMALGVIFGALHLISLALIGLSGFLGAQLRRAIGRLSDNTLVQPFAAALLAGAIGAISVRLEFTTLQRLVAVCPCMVLVPGPHFLNGAIDLLRARIPLGLARLAYASLIVLAISTGLLIGLALGGTSLPPAAPSRAAPLWGDMVAAGVAVAAYGAFFSLPWRLLPVPVLVGMLAHGVHWAAIVVAGASPAIASMLACLLVGTIMSPVADRLRLPFAGLAFASVVSLIPGVFLFRMAGGLVELLEPGVAARTDLVGTVVFDAGSAFLITTTMTVGLILPRMVNEWISARRQQLGREN
ncbi:MAG: threonine/serine exporter family protein [Reyranella sp.]|nr:threonine/serine exporter family protein [Reyranella sp.]